jgi:hypothetical protein
MYLPCPSPNCQFAAATSHRADVADGAALVWKLSNRSYRTRHERCTRRTLPTTATSVPSIWFLTPRALTRFRTPDTIAMFPICSAMHAFPQQRYQWCSSPRSCMHACLRGKSIFDTHGVTHTHNNHHESMLYSREAWPAALQFIWVLHPALTPCAFPRDRP